jgi:hypothetical protein
MRFTLLAETYLTACPECSRSLTAVDGAQRLLGFRLFDPLDVADTLPAAIALSLPDPDRER